MGYFKMLFTKIGYLKYKWFISFNLPWLVYQNSNYLSNIYCNRYFIGMFNFVCQNLYFGDFSIHSLSSQANQSQKYNSNSTVGR